MGSPRMVGVLLEQLQCNRAGPDGEPLTHVLGRVRRGQHRQCIERSDLRLVGVLLVHGLHLLHVPNRPIPVASLTEQDLGRRQESFFAVGRRLVQPLGSRRG